MWMFGSHRNLPRRHAISSENTTMYTYIDSYPKIGKHIFDSFNFFHFDICVYNAVGELRCVYGQKENQHNGIQCFNARPF